MLQVGDGDKSDSLLQNGRHCKASRTEVAVASDKPVDRLEDNTEQRTVTSLQTPYEERQKIKSQSGKREMNTKPAAICRSSTCALAMTRIKSTSTILAAPPNGNLSGECKIETHIC
eukprot:2463736-Pyramimonas_sp.AAC.1